MTATRWQALLETANCPLADFNRFFGELCRKYPEVGLPHAEAMLSRRAGLGKPEAKEMATQATQAAGAENASLPQVTDAWPPSDLLPLAGAPFSLATNRLAPKNNAAAAMKKVLALNAFRGLGR